MPTGNADRARAMRRRRKHERQAVIFGSLVAGLAICGLAAAAVYTDALSLPFLERELTQPPAEAVAEAAPVPCPAEGTLPVPFNTIEVNVLNGSGRAGLAGSTSTALTGRGFLVLTTDNYPARIESNVQINFGESGMAAAYTLAANVHDPVLVLDLRQDATVDLVLGTLFDTLIEPSVVALDPEVPLVGTPGCVALAEALAEAAPAPVVETPDTTEETPLQDGGEGFDEDAPPEGEGGEEQPAG